jgi:alginate O-acetyltransferase complex protein AlgI
MVFASLLFLFVFLPLNLGLYYAWPNITWRNWVLLVFSVFFYAWGEPIWLSLLMVSTTFDYFIARVVEKSRGTPKAKAAVVGSLVVNLGLLGVFKYAGFFVDTVNAALGTHLAAPPFSLPIGISFYTFQSISYVLDVYRGDVAAQKSYPKFLLFISLYHQLVAGPIVRYVQIADEIDHRKHTVDDFSSGVVRLCVGLFKKVCIANVAGELVMGSLGGPLSHLSVAESWFGLAMYTVQIYFDFSGYSDMAIGMGRMFGFHYLENFDHPYTARSVSDFWRRWHISLSTFFRDYVYIPLGGKQRWPYRNLLIVWGLTGLWHGASWNFIFWGLYYGLLIALERLGLGKLLARLPRVFQHAYLMFVVMVGWALFYFTDLSKLGSFFALAFGFTGAPLLGPALGALITEHAFWLALTVLLCLPLERWQFILAWRDRKPLPWGLARVLGTLSLTLLATAMLVGKSYNPFLYFRF